MTPEEALKIDPARYSVHGDVATALRVLQNALREAQAQTVQMTTQIADLSACMVPLPAARTYDDGVRACIAAVTKERARYDAGDYDAESVTCSNTILCLEELLSPAPAVAPVAQKHDLPECDDCDGKGGFDGYGKPSDHPSALRACESCDGTGRVAPVAAPTPVNPPGRGPGIARLRDDPVPRKFDAEAALVAMRDHLFVKNAAVFPTPEADLVLFYALEAGLAAGRGARS